MSRKQWITEQRSRLIEGEDYPPYKDGLPACVKIKGVVVKKKLNTDFEP